MAPMTSIDAYIIANVTSRAYNVKPQYNWKVVSWRTLWEETKINKRMEATNPVMWHFYIFRKGVESLCHALGQRPHSYIRTHLGSSSRPQHPHAIQRALYAPTQSSRASLWPPQKVVKTRTLGHQVTNLF